MADLPPKRDGCYERQGLLGRGGQGKVYREICVEPNSSVLVGEIVAIKILDRQFSSEKTLQHLRKLNETLKALRHENIVQYRDFFVTYDDDADELGCIVTELLTGRDLKKSLDDTKSKTSDTKPVGLPWEKVKAIFEHCASGLAYACSRGIVHRDLKPANIFITDDGCAKLVDFDIAHFDAGEQSTWGGVKGTLDYMAPEVLVAKPSVNYEQADVFSFGVCFFEALTGELPFPKLEGPDGGSGDVRAYMARWLSSTPPELSFSHKVFRVVPQARVFANRCLAVKREERFASFAEVHAALSKVQPRKVTNHETGDAYVCVEWINRGGFAEVYKARRVRDNRTVALKHLLSDKYSPERFRREGDILKRLKHDHLVQFIDFLDVGKNDSHSYFLVLEYLEGGAESSLRGRIKAGNLTVEEIIKLFDGYLDALEYLHSENIIHRDIKPGNLYAPVGHPEKAIVFDLGVARNNQGTLTAGMMPGTPDYMPPEFAPRLRKGVLEFNDRGTPQSDIYPIGLCLYESIVGKPAYPRLSGDDVQVWLAFMERAEKPPQLDFSHPTFIRYPKLKDIILKAIDQNPKKRFSSAEEMRRELCSIIPLPEGGPGPVPNVCPKCSQYPCVCTIVVCRKCSQYPCVCTIFVCRKCLKNPCVCKTEPPEPPPWWTRPIVKITAICIGIAVLIIGSISWIMIVALPGRVDAFLESGAIASRDYVARLSRYSTLAKCDLFSSDKHTRQAKFDEHVQSLPSLFSNEFARALSSSNDAETSKLLAVWTDARIKLLELGVTDEAYSQLCKWMQSNVSNGIIGDIIAGLSGRIPDRIEFNNIQTSEALLVDIEKATDKNLSASTDSQKTAFFAMREKMVTRMESFLKDNAMRNAAISDDNAYRKLTDLRSETPNLVECTKDAYARTITFVDEQRLIRGVHFSAQTLVKSASAVQDEPTLKEWLSNYSKLITDSNISKEDAEALKTAITVRYRTLAGEACDHAVNCFTQDNLNDGNKAGEVLDGLVTVVKSTFSDDSQLGVMQKKVRDSRSAASERVRQKEAKKISDIVDAVKTVGNLQKRAVTGNAPVLVSVVREMVDVRNSLPSDILLNADVATAFTAAASTCRASLLKLMSRHDDPAGRFESLDAVRKLLEDKTILQMIEDEKQSLVQSLKDELDLFIVGVVNVSQKTATLRIPADRIEVKTPSDSGMVLTTLSKSVEGAHKTVVFEASEVGYEPQTNSVLVRRGGGKVLSVASFQVSKVLVSLNVPAIPSGEPPVQVTYKGKDDAQWTDWPGYSVRLLPGEYDFRFTRDDYVEVSRIVRIAMGAGSMQVPTPTGSEWVPSDGLKTLQKLVALTDKKDWSSLAEWLAANPTPKLRWAGFADKCKKLREDCCQQITQEIVGKIPEANSDVLAYCSYLYQWDLSAGKLRRLLKGASSIPDLTATLPAYPATLINDSSTKAQYLRLKAWREAATTLKDNDSPKTLVTALNRTAEQLRAGAPDVADRCQFESVLLQWDFSGPVPLDIKTKQPEYLRWQAHASFRPGEPQPDILGLLAQFSSRGEHPDRYDVMLALGVASCCWENYVQSVLAKKKDGYVVAGKERIYDPKRAYEEAVIFHRPAARIVLESLLGVLNSSGGNVAAEVVAYFKTKPQDPQSLLVAKAVAELPVFSGTSLQREMLRLKAVYDKTAPAEMSTLKDLLGGDK